MRMEEELLRPGSLRIQQRAMAAAAAERQEEKDVVEKERQGEATTTGSGEDKYDWKEAMVTPVAAAPAVLKQQTEEEEEEYEQEVSFLEEVEQEEEEGVEEEEEREHVVVEEEQEQEQEASSPSSQTDDVGILFLAHDGVANPLLWEKWRQSDGNFSERINFFVFRNTKIAHSSTFAEEHDLHLRIRTKWCSSSIVKATIDSLEAVLQKAPTVGMVYIVSGFDIPIQPPAALFTTRAVVTEGVPKTVVPFRTVLAYTPAEDATLKATPGWGKRNEDIREKVACHVQWCGVTRAHAQRVIDYPDLERVLLLGNKMSQTCCPDEWLFGTILALQLENDDKKEEEENNTIIDWTITDQYRAGRNLQSPLLWPDLETTKQRVFWAPPQTYRTFTLARVVEEVSRNEGNLFFRKVGPLTEGEIERLVPPLYTHTHTYTQTNLARDMSSSSTTTGVDFCGGGGESASVSESESSSRRSEKTPSPLIPPSTPSQKRGHGRTDTNTDRDAHTHHEKAYEHDAAEEFGLRVRERRVRRGCPERGGCCGGEC